MEQEQQVADSGQDSGSDAGFDMDQATDQLASDLFPTSEKSTEFDDSGDVIDHVDEAEIQADAAQDTQQDMQTQAEEVEPAPKSWPKEMHDHWGKTPKEVRDYWNVREKQMLEGLDQYKGDAAYGKSMKEAITPYMALIQAQGIDAPKAVQSLLNAHYRLSVSSPSQKLQMLDYIAKQYNIDTSAWKGAQGNEQQQSVDPRYQQLQDQLHGLQQHIQSQSQATIKQEQERIAKEVNTFASDAAHPYFDEVADDMIVYLRAGTSLQDAYDKAVWANPVTRAKEQARVQQDQQAEIKRKAQEAADAAKKATAANIRSRDTRRTPTEQSRATIRNLDSVMTDVMKEIKATRSH